MESLPCDNPNEHLHFFDTDSLIDVSIDLSSNDFIYVICKVQPCPNRYKIPTEDIFEGVTPENTQQDWLNDFKEKQGDRYVIPVGHQERFCGTRRYIRSQVYLERPKLEIITIELPSDIIIRTPHNFESITAVTGTTLAGPSTIHQPDTTDDYSFESISVRHPAARLSTPDHDQESEEEVDDLIDQTFHSAISAITVVPPITQSTISIDEEDEDFVLNAFWP